MAGKSEVANHMEIKIKHIIVKLKSSAINVACKLKHLLNKVGFYDEAKLER